MKLLLVLLRNNDYKLIFFCTNAGFGEVVVKSGDTVGVVEALDIVARWCVVAAPLGGWILQSYICNTCKHGS